LAGANARRDWRVFEALGHRLIAIVVIDRGYLDFADSMRCISSMCVVRGKDRYTCHGPCDVDECNRKFSRQIVAIANAVAR